MDAWLVPCVGPPVLGSVSGIGRREPFTSKYSECEDSMRANKSERLRWAVYGLMFSPASIVESDVVLS